MYAGGQGAAARVVVGMDAAMEDDREAARQGAFSERRKWRTEQKERVDEMLPKATGRCQLMMPFSFLSLPQLCRRTQLCLKNED